MATSAAKPVAVFALILGVWVLTYWLYEPGPPPITFSDTPPTTQAEPAKSHETQAVTPPPAPAVERQLVDVTGVLPPKFTEYTVQPSDTSLAIIAKKTLGDAKLADAVSRANPLVTPNKLYPGRTVLRIPVDPDNIQGRLVTIRTQESQVPPALATTATPVVPGVATAPRVEYEVKPEDTLSSIAKQFYGKAAAWQRIYEANRDRIDNPNRVKPGVRLVIPAAPST